MKIKYFTMRKSLFFILIFSLFIFELRAQCQIDYSVSTPDTANFALSPEQLPNGIVGQLYQEDMTFILPIDTTDQGFTVTFTDFHIVSISLPPGLEWECNNSDCHYDPSVSVYGCVNVFGTPLLAGLFDVEVTLIATHDFSSIAGTETIVFDLPLEIENIFSSNEGFSMTPPFGCTDLTVDFINNNPGLVSYYWDFGNGTMSNFENPPSQIYQQAGEYIVSYEAFENTEATYILTDITIAAAANWGNSWGDEENLGLTDPDPYFYLYDGQGNIVYSSTVQEETNFPASWNVGQIFLENQNYLIEAWEQDGVVSDDDYLGQVSFGGHDQNQSSTYTINNGSLTIQYSIMVIHPNPITFSDTIFVYETPDNPNIDFDGSELILLDDYSENSSYNWYFNNAQINQFQLDLSIEPQYSGYYQLQLVNENGCYSFSDQILVCAPNIQPVIAYEDEMLSVLDSNMYYNVSWYQDNGLIFDATNFSITSVKQGNYNAVVVDMYGCEYSSEIVQINNHSSIDNLNDKLIAYPNPFNDFVVIDGLDLTQEITINIRDLSGKLVYDEINFRSNTLSLEKLSSGIYYLSIFENSSLIKSIKLHKR
tara:strand:+ start:203 stop:1984 length:1782 start_codon:yes stop_codon:yes gene_type:complete